VIRIGPALILALLVVILTLASPYFLTGDNLSNVLVQVAPLACLAIGQLFVILVGGIDLSVGSVLALCTVTGALAYGWGDLRSGALTVATILLTGVAVGALNGVMLVKGRMPHAFIPTLATLNAARGLALLLADGAPMPGMPAVVKTAGAGELGPIPVPC
jgi:ribose transport system permease protein